MVPEYDTGESRLFPDSVSHGRLNSPVGILATVARPRRECTLRVRHRRPERELHALWFVVLVCRRGGGKRNRGWWKGWMMK